MLLHYLKIALRNLLKYKQQSVINVAGLAIGFTVFALAGYWYEWEHSFDTFHSEWKRTFAITTTGIFKTATGEDGELNQLHKSDAEILASFPQVEKICRMRVVWETVKFEKDRQERLYGYCVDSAFFSVFQSVFLEGNVYKTPYNNEYVVLTRSAAMRLFGTIECVGETLSLNRNAEVKVAAVMEDYPGNTEFLFNMLILSPDDKMNNNRGRSICVVVAKSLKEAKVLREMVENHKSVAVDPLGIDQPQRWRFNLRALPELHFSCNQSLNGRFRNIEMLFWTGFLLLLCALMNNLVLFIGQQQHKLKKSITYISLGAKPANLFIQYLLCLLLPVLSAYLLSLVILELIYPLFNDFTIIRSSSDAVSVGSVRGMEPGGLLTGSAKQTTVFLLVYILFACFPILHFVRCAVGKSRKGSSPLLRGTLIVGQVFIGSLFLIASVGMYKQLHFMKNSPKGIEWKNVLQVYLGDKISSAAELEAVKERMLQLPEIEDATLTVDPLLLSDGRFNNLGLLWVEGRDIEKSRLEMKHDNFYYVRENFFDFFRIQFLDGKCFEDGDEYAYVVNETAAKNIGLDNLLQCSVNKGTGRISGIVKDYHYAPMQYPIESVIFCMLDKENKQYENYKYAYIKTSSKNIRRIKELVSGLGGGDMSREDRYIWLSDIEDEFNRPETTIFTLFSIFALLCIFISSFGIYSLVALSAEQRKKEIAIRKVNGAKFKDILQLFLKEYLILVVIGNLTALPIAYIFISRWLESYAYQTEIGFGLFISVFFITCGIVIFSVARQVKIASGVNIAESVSSE